MSSYQGRHAELYDIIYRDKPYSAEALFIHSCLQQYSIGTTNRILELACGTGTHAFELEKLGYQIVATDYSPDVVAVAKKKAREKNSTIDFQHQDMRSLALGGTQFDAAYCLFDSIGYVVTNDAIKKTLQGIHQGLRPDGLFVFEFWHGAAMLRSYEPLRIRRWPLPDGELLRIAETTIDPARQICNVSYSIYELKADGRYFVTKEMQTNRYFLVQEMSAFLTENGFTPLKWFSGFSDSELIDDTTWHIVALARKKM